MAKLNLKDFIVYLEKDRHFSQHSIDAYNTALKQFAVHLKLTGKLVADVEDVDVQEFLRQFKPSTAAQKLSAIREFYKWCLKHGLKSNPTDLVERAKIPKRIPVWLEPWEIKKVRAGLEKDRSWEGIRDRAIIEVLYCTGIRNEPLRNIKLNDVDLQAQTMRVISKGNKEQVQDLNTTTVNAIQKWLDIRKATDGHLFIKKNGGWLKYRKDLNDIIRSRTAFLGKKIRAHTLRHTHITHLYMKTKDPRLTQESAGHASITTTMGYVHAVESGVKEAREALG